jgi:uncharacterized membrane protein YidH (DUF202 family)
MAPPDDIEDIDPGLASERTDLAWTRTAISFAATGAAILKNHVVAGVIVLALGVVTWALRRLFPRLLGPLPSARWSIERRLLVVTIAVTGVGVVALVVALTAHPSGFR